MTSCVPWCCRRWPPSWPAGAGAGTAAGQPWQGRGRGVILFTSSWLLSSPFSFVPPLNLSHCFCPVNTSSVFVLYKVHLRSSLLPSALLTVFLSFSSLSTSPLLTWHCHLHPCQNHPCSLDPVIFIPVNLTLANFIPVTCIPVKLTVAHLILSPSSLLT